MVPPAQSSDLHRKVSMRLLHEALSWEEQRHVHQEWTVQWQNSWLQITRTHAAPQLAGRKITVRQTLDGQLHLLYRGTKLNFRERPVKKQRQVTPTAPKKEEREEAFNEKKEKSTAHQALGETGAPRPESASADASSSKNPPR